MKQGVLICPRDDVRVPFGIPDPGYEREYFAKLGYEMLPQIKNPNVCRSQLYAAVSLHSEDDRYYVHIDYENLSRDFGFESVICVGDVVFWGSTDMTVVQTYDMRIMSAEFASTALDHGIYPHRDLFPPVKKTYRCPNCGFSEIIEVDGVAVCKNCYENNVAPRRDLNGKWALVPTKFAVCRKGEKSVEEVIDNQPHNQPRIKAEIYPTVLRKRWEEEYGKGVSK